MVNILDNTGGEAENVTKKKCKAGLVSRKVFGMGGIGELYIPYGRVLVPNKNPGCTCHAPVQ